jgi:hypothetical protein
MKKTMFGIFCGVAWVLASTPFLFSIELPPEPFLSLGCEEFRERESAQAELLDWARGHREAAIEELFRQSRVADNPEVRERCLGVLRELIYDEEGEGYIGIRMHDELANVPGDPKPRAVIRVMQVVPDSAGHQAGLQFNDHIIGLGDHVWYESPASLSFGEKIRQLKPKAKIMLKVLRNGEMIGVEVKLGRRPLFADNPFLEQRHEDLEAAERAAKEACFHRWLERRKTRN